MRSAYQPLHHKYRPQRLDQLVGQEAIAATLGNALRSGRIAPAYLFSGPRGTGKTSSARILARSLNCLSSDGPTPEPCGSCDLCTAIAAGTALDVIEIDAASNTGVDNIRELIERSRFAPVQARWKVYVVDECHMLSTAAFNALLKTLEEPPPRVVFVLATTDPQRVLPTILSRCQRFDFRRIPLEALEGHLRWIAAQEEIPITAEALHVVAQRAQGGLRDAESLLDQLSLLPAPIEPAAVWELLGAVPEQELLQLATALAASEPLGVIEAIRTLLERGREPAAVLQGLAGLLRDLVLAGVAPDRLELTGFSPQFRPELPALARRLGKARLLQWQAQLKGSEQQLRQSVQPRLWLEVLLLGLLAEAPAAVAVSATVSAAPAGTPQAAVPQAVAPPPPVPAPPVPRPSAPLAAPEAVSAPSAASDRPASPEPAAQPEGSGAGPDLRELWQQILAGLELPSTRMLLSQQAHLARLDTHRAVVQVAGNWMAMVQGRLPLLEKAVATALGSPRQVVLEAGHGGSGVGAQTGIGMPATAPAAAGAPVTAAPGPQATTPAPTAAATTSAPTGPRTPDPEQTTARPAAGAATSTASAEPVLITERGTAPSHDPTASSGPASDTPASAPAAAAPMTAGVIDERARRLADFFNGEVVQLEEPLPGLGGGGEAAA
ncbi:MAG: DNA polymerase III subunit gamma/tau [Synechococcaceae bacterium WB4_1_0192]|nr:DNA polymerase III subunit gamma/tau [Synechococcaceae bacterium WB4_1_0192]